MLEIIGGPERDRTDDLFHAMEARSQTAPQAHILQGCNLSIVSAGAGFVKPGRIWTGPDSKPESNPAQSRKIGPVRNLEGNRMAFRTSWNRSGYRLQTV